jgi:hypothetical protein
VTANRYTKGAVERAGKAGIRPLMLTGLTTDRLAAHIQTAFQSIVYLLLVIGEMRVICDVAETRGPAEILVFYNEARKKCGSVPFLVWKRWLDGSIPSSIGQHKIDLEIPPDWFLIVDDKIEPIVSVNVTVDIKGLLISLAGEASQHALISAIDKKVEKMHVNAEFNTSNAKYPVRTFNTEADLDKYFIDTQASVKVTTRERLPRIRLGHFYLPPSERVARTISAYHQAYLAGELPQRGG